VDEPGEDSALNKSAGTSTSEQKNQAIVSLRSNRATDSASTVFPRTIATISGPKGTSTFRAKRSGTLASGRNTQKSVPAFRLGVHPSNRRGSSIQNAEEGSVVAGSLASGQSLYRDHVEARRALA
jgi:hypothetical protein